MQCAALVRVDGKGSKAEKEAATPDPFHHDVADFGVPPGDDGPRRDLFGMEDDARGDLHRSASTRSPTRIATLDRGPYAATAPPVFRRRHARLTMRRAM